MDGRTRTRPRRQRLLAIGTALWFALATGLATMAAIAPAMAADPSPTPRIADPWHHVGEDGQPVVDLWFGWSSTCPHCARARAWLTDWAPTVPWLEVHSLQVDGADGAADVERLVALAASIGATIDGVPAFLFGGRLEVGFDEADTSGARLEAALAAYHATLVADVLATPAPAPSAPGGSELDVPILGRVDAGSFSLPVLAVVLGGLDAVNPCALSILLFLVSALVGARARGRVVLVGGAFIVATGIVYFLLMAAWLNAFLWFGELRAVTALAGAAAIVAGTLNLKDFGWFRRGPSLIIPESAKPAIFGRILDVSDAVALPALIGTAVVVAATASAYEMLCTGGFPVVFTRALTLADLATPVYYAYLALYVAVYVLPMVAIVGFFAVTLGSRGLSIDEARRLKLLSGLLMVGIGITLLLAPDRLSDLAWTLGLFLAAIIGWLVLVAIDRHHRSPSLAQVRK